MKYLMMMAPLFVIVVTTGCDQVEMNKDRQAQRQHEQKTQDTQNKHEIKKFQAEAALRWENAQIMKDKELAWQLKENEAAGKRRQKRLEEINRTTEVQQEADNAFYSPLVQVLTLLWIAGFAYIYLGKKEIEGAVHKHRYTEEEETKRFTVKAAKDTFDKHWEKLSQNERKTLLGSLEKLALTYHKKEEDKDDPEKLG